MLKGIPKLLNGDLLKALSDMGHGDLLAIVDANYPAITMAKRVIEMPGAKATDVLAAIMKVFPIDHITKVPVRLMALEKEDVEAGMTRPAIFDEFDHILNSSGEQKVVAGEVCRNTFYEMSKNAFVIIHTGEERLYGNLLLIKGVVL